LIRFISQEKYKEFTNDDGNLKDPSTLVDFIVMDWKGIQIQDGKKVIEFECTKESKLVLLDRFPSRWGFILKKALDFRTFFDYETNEKN